jgi:MOSC domain-containing protein YiiM
VPSGIDKHPVDGPVRLTKLGFCGDGQGDTRHHGGPDKAVHHYPLDHYAEWRKELGPLPLFDQAGAFGENISTLGLVETDVALGDRFRLGTALVEVSQGRQPCFRLNLRAEVTDMGVRMQRSGRSGWYYREVEEGVVAPGDGLKLTDRVTPDWTIARLWRILFVDKMDRESLSQMAALTHLPESWRTIASKRLGTGLVEDWSRRLEGS